jgi:UPF0176 protein
VSTVLNVAAYRFVALDQPDAWRSRVRERVQAAALKGTVLIAPEGLNLVLAGAPAAVHGFIGWLRAQPGFDDLPVHESRSATVPFARLVVKVKREIIRMDCPAIRPQAQRAPVLPAQTLARWLDDGVDDAGREVVLLDTRNGFEVDHGRFRGALDWRLARFGEFAPALQAHQASLAGKTVVSYCTGGIRCEKAALLMQDAGVERVWQLDGGILGYLREVGSRHFEGDCFVFDARGTLNATLEPTSGA